MRHDLLSLTVILQCLTGLIALQDMMSPCLSYQTCDCCEVCQHCIFHQVPLLDGLPTRGAEMSVFLLQEGNGQLRHATSNRNPRAKSSLEKSNTQCQCLRNDQSLRWTCLESYEQLWTCHEQWNLYGKYELDSAGIANEYAKAQGKMMIR